jgi:hypothetical protein
MDFENQDQLFRYLDVLDKNSISDETTLHQFIDLLPQNKKIKKLNFTSMTLEGMEKLSDILINQDMNIEIFEILRFNFSMDEALCQIIENNHTIHTLILNGFLVNVDKPLKSLLKNEKIHTLSLESELLIS